MQAKKRLLHPHYGDLGEPGVRHLQVGDKIELLVNDDGSVVMNARTRNRLTVHRTRLTVKLPNGSRAHVYHLQLAAFGVPRPSSEHDVHHIDRDHDNGSLCNLQWLHRSEHAAVTNRSRAGEKRRRAEEDESFEDERWARNAITDAMCGQPGTLFSNRGRIKRLDGSVTRGYQEWRRPLYRRFHPGAKVYRVHQYVYAAFHNRWPPRRGERNERGELVNLNHDDEAPLLADGSYRNWLEDITLDTARNNLLSLNRCGKKRKKGDFVAEKNTIGTTLQCLDSVSGSVTQAASSSCEAAPSQFWRWVQWAWRSLPLQPRCTFSSNEAAAKLLPTAVLAATTGSS